MKWSGSVMRRRLCVLLVAVLVVSLTYGTYGTSLERLASVTTTDGGRAYAAVSGPVLLSSYPADNAVDIPAGAQIRLTFDEPVVRGTGNTAITIRRVADNSIVESFAAATSNRISISSSNRTLVTINPSVGTLQAGVNYYILMDQGAFRNEGNGANYAGISSATALNFAVVAADQAAPVLASRIPAQGGVLPYGASLELLFSKPVFAASGTITIQRSNGDTQAINVTSTGVSGSGTDSIRITPPTALEPSSSYTVSLTTGAFQDASGNNLGAVSNWSFTTAAAPVAMPVLFPADNAVQVAPDAAFTMQFDQPMVRGNGSITIRRIDTNAIVQTIAASSQLISFNGNVVTIQHQTLQGNTGYYVLVDQGALVLASDNSTPFHGIHDASQWNFTTLPGNDTTAPTVSSLSPATNSSTGVLNPKLEITFSEPVFQGTGQITIRNAASQLIVASIPVTSNQVTGGGTNKITIDPNVAFANNTSYYVQIGALAFRDAAGNNFAGITNATSWRFTVALDTQAPLLSALSPVNGSTTVPLNAVFTATFNKPIEVGTGMVTLRRTTGNAVAVAGALSIQPDNNRQARIEFPAGALLANTAYHIEIGAGAVQDVAGNAFVGILNEYQWAFRTIGSDVTAPTLLAASLSGNTRIVLTYNEALDENSVPSPANYYVTVAGTGRPVTRVEVTGSTVTLTLSSAVSSGQQVRVSYSRGTQPVQDVSGNVAAALSSYELGSGSGGGTTTPVAGPRPLSGSVSGSLLTLTFSDTLAAVNAAAFSQFSVNVGGSSRSVTAIASGGTVVVLTLGSAVTDGQAVTVSYTPGSNALRDGNSNAVQAFSGFAVRNALDTQAPTLQQATVNGAVLTLQYNESLDTTSTPLGSQFVVTVNGNVRNVAAVTITNQQVLLTLGAGVAVGEAVTLSYVGGSPALRDLAANAAATLAGQTVTNLTGISGGAGGGSVGGLVSAVTSGQEVILTFNQTLNNPSISLDNQFYVKMSDLIQTVTQTSVSGSTVRMRLPRMPTTGERISVSYIGSGTPLRTAGGTAIAAFTDFPVNGGSGGLGDLPWFLEADARGGVAIRLNAATTASDTSPGGRAVNRYTLTADHVMSAYSSLRSASGVEPVVRFTVPEAQAAAIVAVPVRQLEDAYRAQPNASFAIAHKNIIYTVPLASLDYGLLGQLAGSGVTSGHLVLKIDGTSTPDNLRLSETMQREAATPLVPATDFQMTVVNGSTERIVERFNGYLQRTFELPSVLNARSTAAVWLDPETNRLSYVPTRLASSGGRTTVTVLRQGNSAYAVVSRQASFSDLSGHWGRNDMLLLASKYITEGRTATLYEPNRQVTRGEFATFIARGLGLSGNRAAAARFRDVSAATSMAAYVGAAAEAGIVEGNPDGTFRPNSFITREEMAVMMVRAAASAGVQVALARTPAQYVAGFRDRDRVAPWAAESMAKAIEMQVIGGKSATLLAPKDDATRAEATVMIKRLLVYLELLAV